jgi:hypothetical protein
MAVCFAPAPIIVLRFCFLFSFLYARKCVVYQLPLSSVRINRNNRRPHPVHERIHGDVEVILHVPLEPHPWGSS